HLLVVHLADIAEEMSGEGARRVDALGLDLHDDSGQVEAALPELRDLLERQPPTHALGTDGVGGHLVDRVLQFRQGDLEQDRHPREDGVAILELPGNQREREGGAVVDEGLPVAVEEDAARRRHRSNPDPVLVRHLLQAPALERLQIPELAEEADETRYDEDSQREHPMAPIVAPVDGAGRYTHRRLRATSRPSTQSNHAEPVKPLYTACGRTTCIISPPNETG